MILVTTIATNKPFLMPIHHSELLLQSPGFTGTIMVTFDHIFFHGSADGWQFYTVGWGDNMLIQTIRILV